MANDDIRSMYDKPLIGAWDLDGRDVTLTIRKVEAKKLKSAKGEETKPIVYFERTNKGFVLNVTNREIVAGLYGYKTSAWIGKQITIYPTQTSVGGKVVDTIRVRPTVPKGKQSESIDDTHPVDEAMRANQEEAIRASH